MPSPGCLLYVEDVSQLEIIVKNLKALPPVKLEMAADFIHRLTVISEDQRRLVLARTSGSLSHETADIIEKEIAGGCEKIDEPGW